MHLYIISVVLKADSFQSSKWTLDLAAAGKINENEEMKTT